MTSGNWVLVVSVLAMGSSFPGPPGPGCETLLRNTVPARGQTATLLRYSVSMNHQDTIEAGTRLYERTGATHESARTDLVAAVLAALRDGEPPTDVAAWSPFTEAYVRKLARTNGIPEYTFRRFPRAKPWMDEHYPSWPDLARAIADLGVGLDDAEYVGGVIYLGLTHKDAENNPAEQRRAITEPADQVGNPRRGRRVAQQVRNNHRSRGGHRRHTGPPPAHRMSRPVGSNRRSTRGPGRRRQGAYVRVRARRRTLRL